MIRSLSASIALLVHLLAAGALLMGPGATSPAFAQGKAADPKKPDPKAAQAPAPVRPSAVDKINDWGVYVAGSGKAKACYVLAEPKERAPKTLKRDQGYVFITQRPGEGVRNEVSVVMGFDVKPDSTPKAAIGSASYPMIAKGGNLWLKNPAQETDFVNALRKSPKLIVTADSLRGNTTTDTYALAGVGAALDRATKECQ